jgi:peptidoglycan/LPS O-acetylase OafA/YrhL
MSQSLVVSRMPSRTCGRLILGGAAALAIGSVMPWATVNAALLGTYSVSGLHGGGLATLAIALTIGVLARHAPRDPFTKRRRAVIVGVSVLAAVIVAINFADVQSLAGKGGPLVDVRPGIGLFIAAAAVVPILLGTLRANVVVGHEETS